MSLADCLYSTWHKQAELVLQYFSRIDGPCVLPTLKNKTRISICVTTHSAISSSGWNLFGLASPKLLVSLDADLRKIGISKGTTETYFFPSSFLFKVSLELLDELHILLTDTSSA
jgi:hypothetical protein